MREGARARRAPRARPAHRHNLAPPPQTLSESLPAASPSSRQLAAIVAFCRDPVPNIRFNAAKALAKLAAAGKIDAAALAGSVRPAIALLTKDVDDDVRWFAKRAF